MTESHTFTSPPATDVRLGEGGRYSLVSLLGTGGMASVWTAHDARLGRTVAVKIIADTLALDPTFVARFEREARLVAALAHPHVVQVFDYGTYGNRPFLVMDHIGGGTLAARIRAGAREWDPVLLARELLDALSYIHAAGVLHRDIKPANVLIGTDGRARLTDFGIAQLVDDTRLTTTGVMGTAQYTAPEVLRGQPPTMRSDLYSLGVVLRECSLESPALAPLIDALTREDPSDRLASANEALTMLTGTPILDPDRTMPMATPTAAAPTEPVPVTPPPAKAAPTQVLPSVLPAPVPPRRPRHRITPRLAVAGLAVIAALIVVPLALQGNDDSSGPDLPADKGTVAEKLDQLDDLIDQSRPAP